MRRVFVVLLGLMLLMAAAAETNPTDAYKGRWRDAGESGAEMKIMPKYLDEENESGDLALYPIDYYTTDGNGRAVIWTMTARYNAKKGRMEYADGTKIAGGDIVLSGTRGYIKLDSGGKLRWLDSEDADVAKLSFARATSAAPSAEDFADGYFRIVAGLERGGSKAKRNAAKTIVAVLQFAEKMDLWNADGVAMQNSLEAAWNSLSAGERARFDAVFDDGVSDPADIAFDDYARVSRVFDSAGVGKEMARLVASLEVRLSWEFLSSATLNMGNMDDDGYENAQG